MEKLRLRLEKYGPRGGEGNVAEERQQQAFSEFYLPAIQEMAKGIFTPERVRKLILDLKEYRRRLYSAGEKRAAFSATSAVHDLEPEDDPTPHALLMQLCARSLHAIPPRVESPA